MDVRNLRQVLAIGRSGSIAKAAEALGMSQPSLSISLARLEDELGAKVFERTATGSTPTATGKAILARAETLIAEMEGLTRHATLVGNGDAVQLRVGISFGLGPLLLQELVIQIARRFPDLKLHIETASGIDLFTKFDRHDLDIIVCGDRPEIHRHDISLAEAGKARIVAVAPQGHPLQGRKNIDPRIFSRFKNVGALYATYSASSFFHFEDSWYVPTVVTNDPLTFATFVELGYIVVSAEIFVRDIIADGRAIALDLDRESYLPIHVVSKTSTQKSPIVKGVSKFMLDIFRRSLLPDRPTE